MFNGLHYTQTQRDAESQAWQQGNTARNTAFDGTDYSGKSSIPMQDAQSLAVTENYDPRMRQTQAFGEAERARLGPRGAKPATASSPAQVMAGLLNPGVRAAPTSANFGVMRRNGIDPKTGKPYDFVGVGADGTATGGFGSYEGAREASQGSRAAAGLSTDYAAPGNINRGFDSPAQAMMAAQNRSAWQDNVQADMETRANARGPVDSSTPQVPPQPAPAPTATPAVYKPAMQAPSAGAAVSLAPAVQAPSQVSPVTVPPASQIMDYNAPGNPISAAPEPAPAGSSALPVSPPSAPQAVDPAVLAAKGMEPDPRNPGKYRYKGGLSSAIDRMAPNAIWNTMKPGGFQPDRGGMPNPAAARTTSPTQALKTSMKKGAMQSSQNVFTRPRDFSMRGGYMPA